MSIITPTNGPRKWIVNDAGLDIIKTFEGFSSTPYLRIPMIAATDSDASRPPIPTHGGHFVAVSSGAV